MIGNEMGRSADPHYPTIDPKFVRAEIVDELNRGTFGGERFIIAEADTSIRPGWFYHKEQDCFVKTPRQLVDLWFNSVGNSAIMLLNFPPDRRGLVHETDVKNAIDAHNIISRALSVNFAQNATVTADSVRVGFAPDSMVNDKYDAVYSASDDNITPVIEVNLGEKRTFDTVVIGEYIELGVRVRGFKIESCQDGEWHLLADKKSIGYKKAVFVGKTTTDRLRITIYDAAAAPVIREFGLYDFGGAGYEDDVSRTTPGESVDIASNPGAKVICIDDGVVVQFGGIFPFNTVKFNGDGISSYELLIFNGSSFQPAAKGESTGGEVVISLDETVEMSYQIKLKTDKKVDESINIRVYEM